MDIDEEHSIKKIQRVYSHGVQMDLEFREPITFKPFRTWNIKRGKMDIMAADKRAYIGKTRIVQAAIATRVGLIEARHEVHDEWD
ncbi:hypothetical protein IMZ48_46425 [Candidatus Bathyarchaeota archaeon]|nr:hypothetical protein [Candidatus Bathyarchaeota archaeon]